MLKGPKVTATLVRADGSQQDLESNGAPLLINRIAGDTKVQVRLTRASSHTGSCCFRPGYLSSFELVIWPATQLSQQDQDWAMPVPPNLKGRQVDRFKAWRANLAPSERARRRSVEQPRRDPGRGAAQ